VVNFLWSKRQRNFFFARFGEDHRNQPPSGRLRTSFRLFRISVYVRSPLLLVLRITQFIGLIVVQHCFERIIAGRPFKIEVTWVAEKRWRAHIVRIPGVPTAMMPFYGETPDEAAAHLSDWLDRAHQHQANTV
jgi:hypothetical protein